MVDIVDKSTRSRMMSGIRGKDTKPEIAIRKALFREGFRYRIHYRKLPGKPDLVFPKYRAIILINGCFWHRHNCHLFKWPSTRVDFWREKINSNVARDAKNLAIYESLGWKVMTVWECAVKGRTHLSTEEIVCIIINWLQFDSKSAEIAGR
ncbi:MULTISPECIES: very short patch repair endonuclease [unclassified Microbulbifer]|uniref:very short patch repair endonuclease n=1 Tax=unclassified Microbulbifer TaxID=2619833 RepID=UPI0027E3D7E1|nr:MULTISPECIES: very short patch repair endonuclease [unclassified Microbulbifer]